MLNVIMLSVVMLNVFMLSVVGPEKGLPGPNTLTYIASLSVTQKKGLRASGTWPARR
jgi:hypothetical protein